MNFLNITFDLPYAALATIAIILIIALSWILQQYRFKKISAFATPEMLSQLLIPRSDFLYWMKALAICLIWLLATIALMQPKGLSPLNEKSSKNETTAQTNPQIQRKSHLVIFLIDASASMNVTDSRDGKSRFDYAKEIADEVLRQLKGESVALYAFTSELSQLSPPTPDYFFVRLMLRQLQINEGGSTGTDLGMALTQLNQFYFIEPTPDQKTLILLSDGGDNHLENLQGEKRIGEIDHLVNIITPNIESPLRILTIGLGTKKGKDIPGISENGHPILSSLQEDLLKKLSRKSNGRYYEANNQSSLELADKIGSIIERDSIPVTKSQNTLGLSQRPIELIYDLYYQFPLGFALLLLAFVIFLPDTFPSSKSPGLMKGIFK